MEMDEFYCNERSVSVWANKNEHFSKCKLFLLITINTAIINNYLSLSK